MNLEDLVASASAETGLPAQYLHAQIMKESSGRPEAVSPAGAIGLMQILPKAHPEYTGGHDPIQNVQYGSRYQADLLRRFGDPAQAIAAYNAGPGRVRRLVAKHGDKWRDHLPQETKDYVDALLPVYQQNTAQAAAQAASVPQPTDPVQPPRSALEEARARQARREQEARDLEARIAIRAQMDEEAAKDSEWTVAGEVGRAVWGAGVDLATETLIVAKDAARYILPLDKLILGVEEADAANRAGNEAIREGADRIAPDNKTLGGNIGRGLTQFLVPYVGWAKAAGAANTFRAATARGFVIDSTLFDPNQGNLSSLIQELAPSTRETVLDFLATDPDDDEALNRLRNGLEGMALGTVLEGVFRMARWARGTKQIDEAHALADADSSKPADIENLKTETAAKNAEEAKVKEEMEARAKEKVEAGEEPTVTAPDGEQTTVSIKDFTDDLRAGLKLNPEARAKLNALLEAGDEDGAKEILSNDFNLDTIDWTKIEKPDDIKRLIVTVEEAVADHIDNVKGGVQSHVQTKRLANLVGLSGEEVHKLFKDVRGDKGIAARFHAAQRTMLASAKEVFRLRDLARANPQDHVTKAAFFRQVELHAALQAEIKGAQTEIARALNGMAIIKAEAADGFREFDTLMRTMGGKSRTGKEFEKFMDDLLDAKNLDELNAKVRNMTRSERIRNVFVEYVINAMLSSPKTHIINFTSNVLNTFLYTGDRYIAGLARLVTTGDRAALREANIDLMRKLGSLDEAFKLARQAWKDGAPVSDKRQRIEFQTRKAISMEGDSFLAKTVNLLGAAVRVPGRLLITGDEFFKTINRNAELSVLAYRNADEAAEKAGLKYGSPEYKAFVQKRMATLLDPDNFTPEARNIRTEAVEKSRLVTFQEAPRTAGGALMERVINHNVFVKLVLAPFFRTPMNILRQGVLDRTPLGLIMKETRAALANGSPREQAEIMARMTTGVAAMAGFWAFAGTDKDSPIQIVGKVPFDSSEKTSGVLDYSLRIGDQWYQFNRLDPLGMWLGMVADAKMAAEHADDEELQFATLQGALAGFMNNVTNKTWAKSLSDLYEMMDGFRTAEPASVDRAWGKFASGQFGKLIPQLLKSTGAVAAEGDERFAYEAWTFMDGLVSQIPGMREDLPKRHDALGRPVAWDNKWHSVLNPFAISDAPTSPVEKELARLDFTLRPMPKSLGGGLMDLTADEYSKLTGLVGELKISKHGNLEETLNVLVESDRYSEATDELKTYLIKKHIEAARTAARGAFLLEPSMQKRFKDAKVSELSALFE